MALPAHHQSTTFHPQKRLLCWLDKVSDGSPAQPPVITASRKRQRSNSLTPSRAMKRRQVKHLPSPADSADIEQDELSAMGAAFGLPQRRTPSPTKQQRGEPSRKPTLQPSSPGAGSNSSGSTSINARSLARFRSIGSMFDSVEIGDSISQKAAPRSRAASPKKSGYENLQDLDPRVFFFDHSYYLEDMEVRSLPPKAENLSLIIDEAVHDTAFVPQGLQQHYEKLVRRLGRPHRSKKSIYYASAAEEDDQSATLLWATSRKVKRAMERVADVSEAEINRSAVDPILGLVVDEERQFAASQELVSRGRKMVMHLEMTTTSTISRSTASVASSNYTRTSLEAGNYDNPLEAKRVDHALAISLHSSFELHKGDPRNEVRRDELMDRCVKLNSAFSINQTKANPYAAFLAAVEVKKAYSTVDPRYQLGAWFSLGQHHASQLGLDLDIPRIAISVVGHHWSVYVVFNHLDGKAMCCIGPTEIGSTASEEGIFRIVHVLTAIVRWGNTTFRDLIQEGVVDRLDRAVVRETRE